MQPFQTNLYSHCILTERCRKQTEIYLLQRVINQCLAHRNIFQTSQEHHAQKYTYHEFPEWTRASWNDDNSRKSTDQQQKPGRRNLNYSSGNAVKIARKSLSAHQANDLYFLQCLSSMCLSCRVQLPGCSRLLRNSLPRKHLFPTSSKSSASEKFEPVETFGVKYHSGRGQLRSLKEHLAGKHSFFVGLAPLQPNFP